MSASSPSPYLELDLEELLRESEHNIEEEYQYRAAQEFTKNRLSLDFSNNKDFIHLAFAQADDSLSRSRLSSDNDLSGDKSFLMEPPDESFEDPKKEEALCE